MISSVVPARLSFLPTCLLVLAATIQGGIVTALVIMLTAFVISTSDLGQLFSKILTAPSGGYIEIAALAVLGLYVMVGVIDT